MDLANAIINGKKLGESRKREKLTKCATSKPFILASDLLDILTMVARKTEKQVGRMSEDSSKYFAQYSKECSDRHLQPIEQMEKALSQWRSVLKYIGALTGYFEAENIFSFDFFYRFRGHISDVVWAKEKGIEWLRPDVLWSEMFVHGRNTNLRGHSRCAVKNFYSVVFLGRIPAALYDNLEAELKQEELVKWIGTHRNVSFLYLGTACLQQEILVL